MNQMTHFRCGGVPMAQRKTKYRPFAQQALCTMLFLMLVLFGGQAWGQVYETWTNGNSYGGNFYGNNTANGDTYITIDNSTADATVTITSTINFYSTLGTYFNKVIIQPASTAHRCTIVNAVSSGPMFKVWGAGSGWNLGDLTISAGITLDGNGNGNPLIGIYASELGGGYATLGGKCQIVGTASNHVVVKNNANSAIANNWELVCKYCDFENNTSPSSGGAIISNWTINLDYCTFDSNHASSGDGGAICLTHANNGNLSYITNCDFTRNTVTHSTEGRGGAVYFGENGGLFCNGDHFGKSSDNLSGNTGRTRGGALYSRGALVCQPDATSGRNCEFHYNKTTSTTGSDDIFLGGGAVYVRGAFTGTSCVFSHNKSVYDGGALYNYGDNHNTIYATTNLTGCRFEYNEGHNGGAITHSQSALMTATSCTFTGNKALNELNPSSGNIEGGNGGAVFSVSWAHCEFIGCTFTSNRAMSGGAIYSQKALTLERCEFVSNEVIPGQQSGNTINGLGGALFYGGSTADPNGHYPIQNAVLKGCSMHDNTALQGGYGGAIFTDRTSNGQAQCIMSIESVIVNNTTYAPAIYGNLAIRGAGVYAGGDAQVTMSAGEIRGNEAITNSNSRGYGGGVNVTGGTFNLTGGSIGTSGTGNANTALQGGGVYVGDGGIFNLNGANAYVNYNTAYSLGGGIYSRATTNLTNGIVQNNSFTSSSTPYGAGVYVYNGTTTLQGATIQSHSATNGAGVYVAGGEFKLTSGTIQDNGATNGAGVYLNAGTFNLSGGYVGKSGHANAATNGGGVYVAGGIFNMTGGNIIYNTASQDGAGVYLAAGTFNFENQGALEHNTATRNGGGVYVDNTAGFNMKNSLLQLNTAVNGGGVYVNAGGTFTMLGEDDSHSCEVRLNTVTSGMGGGVYHKGTTTLTGLIHINDNTGNRAANNTYLDQSGTVKYLYIGVNGLLCGSDICIKNDLSELTNGEIVLGYGSTSTAVKNAQYAYYNKFFHSDRSLVVSTTNTATPLYDYESKSLYLKTTFGGNSIYALAQNAQSGSDYDGSVGNITAIYTVEGLAYFANDVNVNGNDYSGKTVTLEADITIPAAYDWEPIGYRTDCEENPFKGTFNGKFHIIKNIHSNFGYLDAGFFGYVVGGTIKNVLIDDMSNISAFEGLGGVVGYMKEGNIINCEARVTLPCRTTTATSNCYTGGIAGKTEGQSQVVSCYAITTITGNGNSGGLVGYNGNFLVNSWVRTTTAKAALTSYNNRVTENCYVIGMSTLTNAGINADYCYSDRGTASGRNGVFTATSLVNGKYGYNQQDQQITANNSLNPYVVNGGLSNTGELGGLLATLNHWIGSSNNYTRWTRTMASPINGDYPVLMFDDAVCLGSKDGIFIDYAYDLNTMITAYNAATGGGDIYLYDVPSTVTVANGNNVKIYVNENIGFLQSVTLQNVRTGVTLDNSSSGFMSYDWHMFSPALTNAPMGLTYASQVSSYPIYNNYSNYLANGMPNAVYNSSSINPPATTWNTSAGTIGYFPTNTPYGAPHNNTGCFDFYCYSEPFTHWVNFKREGTASFYDHWRQNEDANGMHQNIPYPNESNMVRGKGYMVAIDKTSMLMTDGSLDNNAVSATVSNTASLTGFEAQLKGVNLIGNPYQAYLDFNQIVNGLNTYFILDADAHGYIAYVNGGSTPSEPSVINTNAPRYLHPHQGFFVRVPQNASSVTFNNTMIVAGKGTSNFRSEENHYPMVNLAVEDERGRRDFATVELDRPDLGGGEKIQGLHAGDASLWVHFNDADWQVAFTPVGTMSVPVRFEAYTDGVFTLSWETHNGYFSYMHLIDNMTGADIDCLETDEYRFEASTHDYTSRFRLVFEYTGVEEQEDGPSTGSGTFAFMMGDELVVNGEGTLQLFDLNGRCLLTETMHNAQSTVSLPDLTTGVYILRLTANQQTRTQKMVINQ